MKRLLVRFGALAAVALLFGLALWSPEVRGDLGGADAARLCRDKVDRLARVAHGGGVSHGTFTEQEVNAHLARLLARNQKVREAQGLTVGIEDLRLDLTGRPSFFVDARLMSIPLVFTVHLTCEGEASTPHIRSAAVGHLPFPGPLKHLVTGRMKPLFAQLRNESVVWQHLTACNVSGQEETTLTLSVDGHSQEPPPTDLDP